MKELIETRNLSFYPEIPTGLMEPEVFLGGGRRLDGGRRQWGLFVKICLSGTFVAWLDSMIPEGLQELTNLGVALVKGKQVNYPYKGPKLAQAR